MQTREYCAYNETRENLLSARVRVIDARAEPLQVVKALIEGLEPEAQAGLWLNPLKSVPTVPRLSAYDLVYLDDECRVVHGVALAPTDEAPQFSDKAASALVLPFRSFSLSQAHAGDRLVLRSAAEMESRPAAKGAAPGEHASAAPAEEPARPGPLWPSWFAARSEGPPPEVIELAPAAEQERGASPARRLLRSIVHLKVQVQISISTESDRTTEKTRTWMLSAAAVRPMLLRMKQAAARAAEIVGTFVRELGDDARSLVRDARGFCSLRRLRRAGHAFCRWAGKAAEGADALGAGAARWMAGRWRAGRAQYARWAERFVFRMRPVRPIPAVRRKSGGRQKGVRKARVAGRRRIA